MCLFLICKYPVVVLGVLQILTLFKKFKGECVQPPHLVLTVSWSFAFVSVGFVCFW